MREPTYYLAIPPPPNLIEMKEIGPPTSRDPPMQLKETLGYVTVGLYEVVGLVTEVAGGSLVPDHPLTSLQREHVIHRTRRVDLESLP